ncbi:hypothetical protein [Microbacterium sp. zg-YB36]|uniref:hypothetical protein n=1 Tax=Microbacterium sp. zg-YB36 TaxID=2969407 RepID=UPI00214CDAFF|nr:hypothetical protein [Microbacterium sp. zg-YB36]MDL5351526.1 hypothetical protein [Microbacterium sp. zg-YB36]
MTDSRSGWPRGRVGWIAGTALLLVLGVLFGMIMGNLWLGLVLAGAVSVGWLIAYESWRGHNTGIYDRDDDGAQL